MVLGPIVWRGVVFPTVLEGEVFGGGVASSGVDTVERQHTTVWKKTDKAQKCKVIRD